jgi:hypothetical protein
VNGHVDDVSAETLRATIHKPFPRPFLLPATVAVGSLAQADTAVMDVSRLAIRVVWRWQTALRGRRATRPEQKSWYATWALPPRSAAERRRLVRSLSDRRDWTGLLRLAMDLPVRDAVVIRRWFSPWWRPADERDRQAYSLLAQARPSTLASAYEVLRQASSKTVMLGGGGNVCWPQAYVYVRPYLKTFSTPFEGLLDRVNRPQAQWTPADLSYVRGARSLAEDEAGILPLYDLVAACMEWRFATDAAPAPSARSFGHT